MSWHLRLHSFLQIAGVLPNMDLGRAAHATSMQGPKMVHNWTACCVGIVSHLMRACLGGEEDDRVDPLQQRC